MIKSFKRLGASGNSPYFALARFGESALMDLSRANGFPPFLRGNWHNHALKSVCGSLH